MRVGVVFWFARAQLAALYHEAASSGQLGTKTVHFLDSDVIRQGSSLGGSGQFSTKIGFLTVCGQTYRRIETESSWLATLSRPRTLLFNVAEPHGPFFLQPFCAKTFNTYIGLSLKFLLQ